MKPTSVKPHANTTAAKVIIDTKKPIRNDGISRLPHERDEAPDDQSIEPKEEMKQAYRDLQQGMVDTDMHGQRGVEEAVKQTVKASTKKVQK